MTQLREKIRIFLKVEFPQINMHGGSFQILDIDKESGRVEIELGDACSGCGISPMTQQAIMNRMPREIDEITTVEVAFEQTDDITTGPL